MTARVRAIAPAALEDVVDAVQVDLADLLLPRHIEGCGGAGEGGEGNVGFGRDCFATVPPRISSSEGK